MGNLSTSKDTDRNRARMFLDVINLPEKKERSDDVDRRLRKLESSLEAGAFRSSLVHVHFAVLHHLSFGFEFGATSATLVFLPK